MLNPLEWKRAHQVGLLICLGLGLLTGCLLGVHVLNPYRYEIVWDEGWQNGASHFGSLNLYWLVVLGVGIFGAGIAGAIVYAIQLLRE